MVVTSPASVTPPLTPPRLAPIAWRWILAVAGITLAVLVALSGRYGYHRDEMYFIEAGHHLALGYPDQPLLTPLVAWTMNSLAPHSLLVLRLPAAAAGIASIVSAALIAREIGGGRRAQAIAATSCAVGAVTLATSHFLTTTALDLAFTSVAWWLLVRLLRSADERLWAALGAVLGLALLNKLVAGAILGSAIVALAALGPRQLLRSRWVWVGAALAVLGVLPYLIWQFGHGLPQLDLVRAESESGDEGGRAGFLPFQLVLEGPLLVPVWLSGLVGLLRRPDWRRYRCLGWAYLALVVLLLISSGKAYYLAGFYPLLLGFGAVPVDAWLARGKRGGRARVAWLAVAIVITALINAVIALPVLPARQLPNSATIGLNSDIGEEVGWPAFTRTVAGVYDRLPAATRQRTAIFTSNYGEAGAIDLLGPADGLPNAYSGHNGFTQWGPPPDSQTSAIVVGDLDDNLLARDFSGCRTEARINNGVGLNNNEQGDPVAFCAAERAPWSAIWTGLRHYN